MKDLIQRLIDKYQSLTVEETLYVGIILLVVIIGLTLLFQSFGKKKKSSSKLDENIDLLINLANSEQVRENDKQEV